MMIKEINEFSNSGSFGARINRGFLIFLALIWVLAIALVFSIRLELVFMTSSLCVVIFVGIAWYTIWRAQRIERFLVERSSSYNKYLSDINIQVLREAVVSPEVSEESKKAISEYLNSNHPGWSFGAAT